MATINKKNSPPPPVLRVTNYEKVSNTLIGVVLGLMVAAFLTVMYYLSTHDFQVEAETELIAIIPPGGEEDGAPNETLKVESPEDITDDPSEADLPSEETQLEETLENVVEFNDNASQFVQDQVQEQFETSGKPGSADGTGRSPLGEGGGEGGLSPAQRWVIRFSQNDTLQEYATQLDYFGIEFGVLKNSKVYYVSNMANAKPTVREKPISKDEQRLYMTWQDSGRRSSDVKLMKKAGVDASTLPVLHFYPNKTESMLLSLELKYRNRAAHEIKRTYFTVRKQGQGYVFLVTRQLYLR